MAGVAAMSMYHQYKMYWSLLQYHSLGEYHGYNYGGHRGILLGMVTNKMSVTTILGHKHF